MKRIKRDQAGILTTVDDENARIVTGCSASLRRSMQVAGNETLKGFPGSILLWQVAGIGGRTEYPSKRQVRLEDR